MKSIKCKKCNTEKLKEKFSKNNSRISGLQKNCKLCNKKYSSENKYRIIEQKRNYYRTPEGIAKQLFDKARYRAKKLNIPFNIKREWVLEQVIKTKTCPIRNVEFVTGNKIFSCNSRTLDRLIPEKGYTKENTNIISFKANLVKNNGSVEDIKKLFDYLIKIEKIKNKTWSEKFIHLGLKKQSIVVAIQCKKYHYNKKIEKLMASDARRRAKNKNMIFSITESDILVPVVCPILHILLQKGKRKKIDNSPTIDRIDNNVGYTPENIQVISNKANIMKSDCSIKEIKQIYVNMMKMQLI